MSPTSESSAGLFVVVMTNGVPETASELRTSRRKVRVLLVGRRDVVHDHRGSVAVDEGDEVEPAVLDLRNVTDDGLQAVVLQHPTQEVHRVGAAVEDRDDRSDRDAAIDRRPLGSRLGVALAHRACSAGTGWGDSSKGRRTLKVVPRPSPGLAASIAPPCSSIR